jgi:hypothetical protein
MIDPSVIIDGLVARGVPLNAAIGIAGNIAVESRFDPGINEIAPLVPGSRGGYGLIQWTGPRRRQFESYAQEQGTGFDNLDTQLDFLTWELQNTESRAGDRIFAASDPMEAARLTSELFLRPGIPHMDRRLSETERLAGMYQPGGNPQMQQPQQGRNALAAPPMGNQQTPQMNALAMQPDPQEQAFNALSQSLRRPIYDYSMRGA